MSTGPIPGQAVRCASEKSETLQNLFLPENVLKKSTDTPVTADQTYHEDDQMENDEDQSMDAVGNGNVLDPDQMSGLDSSVDYNSVNADTGQNTDNAEATGEVVGTDSGNAMSYSSKIEETEGPRSNEGGCGGEDVIVDEVEKESIEPMKNPHEVKNSNSSSSDVGNQNSSKEQQMHNSDKCKGNVKSNSFTEHQGKSKNNNSSSVFSFSWCSGKGRKSQNVQDTTKLTGESKTGQVEGEEDEFIKAYHEANRKYEYFWRSESVYSQWHKFKMYEDGIEFNCAEQYMMYHKAKLFQDDETAKKILKCKDPRKQKAYGREVKHFNQELWDSQSYYIVKSGNRLKFNNPGMKKLLYSTYGQILVEASPRDQIWGIGLDENSPGAWDMNTWEGKNLLGYALTEVRDELMKGEGIIEEKLTKYYDPEKKLTYHEKLIDSAIGNLETDGLDANRDGGEVKTTGTEASGTSERCMVTSGHDTSAGDGTSELCVVTSGIDATAGDWTSEGGGLTEDDGGTQGSVGSVDNTKLETKL